MRERLNEHLQHLIDGSDAWPKTKRYEFVGSLQGTPGLRRLARRTKTGLLRTSDLTQTAEDLAAAYKQLLAVERGWRDCKTSLGLRPVYHHREDRTRAHVQLCGWHCCSSGSRKPVPATPGATCAINSTACIWSPSPPPTAASRNAPPSPATSRPSSPRSTSPNPPNTSTFIPGIDGAVAD